MNLEILARMLAGGGQGYLNFQQDRQRQQALEREQALREQQLQQQIAQQKQSAGFQERQIAAEEMRNKTAAAAQAATAANLDRDDARAALDKILPGTDMYGVPGFDELVKRSGGPLAGQFNVKSPQTTTTPTQASLPGPAMDLEGKPAAPPMMPGAMDITMQGPGAIKRATPEQQKTLDEQVKAKLHNDTLKEFVAAASDPAFKLTPVWRAKLMAADVKPAEYEPNGAQLSGNLGAYLKETYGDHPTSTQIEEGTKKFNTLNDNPFRPYAPTIYVGQNGPMVVDKTTNTATPIKEMGPNGQPTGADVGRPLPPAAQVYIRDNELAASNLNDIIKIKKDEWLGPLDGRKTKALIAVPGMKVAPDLAEFSAKTAQIRNATIKAITGAALGEKEATRIREQIPDFTDKPEVWEQKAKATLENIAFMIAETRRLAGAQQPPAKTTPPPANPKIGDTWQSPTGPVKWDGKMWK